MVPTEILARQHYQELAPLFEALGFSVGLLVGSCSAKEKAEVRRRLNAPEGERLSLLIGTHALLEEGVVFSALALTVTDEQHRFGVMQGAALQKKGQGAHLLVMSATPIPRTLALTLYGDLAVSRIEQMPAGRQKVSTFVLDDSYRPRLYGFLREQVRTGGQVYMVCPAIEDKEEAEDEEISLSDLLQQDAMPPLRSAEGLVRSLREEIFPDIPIGYLHGRMRGVDKDAEMRRFATGETKILVSTTVIEVGVNVPEATVMVVENAERFGLSQLHQLRGRVGRGSRKSYCFLLSQIKSGPAYERLQTMHTTYDGYEIAKADLAQRGPGDFFSSLALSTQA